MTDRPRHLPVLDGLRAIAVLLVLWSHVTTKTPGYPQWLLTLRTLIGPGGMGVEIFFVLSGFLITRILMAERENERPVRWFLLRRVLRIFPIYYLLLVVMLVVDPRPEIGWCAVYLSNVITITDPARDFPLQHTWSLCVEEHFYLLWPLVVAFSRPGRPARILVWFAMPAALGAALLVGFYGQLQHAHVTTQHCSPIRFFSLGAGCLLAYAEPSIRARPWRWAGVASLLLIPAFLANNIVQFVLLPHWLELRGGPLLPLQAGPALWLVGASSLATSLLLFCLVAGHQRWSPLRILTWAPLRGIGRISYGIYLYHLPIFHAWLRPEPSGWRVIVVVTTTIAVASASYWIVERPLLRYGSKLR
ncbi:MAG: acyltransferase [bacterium]|nr:acyltransferase [bacterium]